MKTFLKQHLFPGIYSIFFANKAIDKIYKRQELKAVDITNIKKNKGKYIEDLKLEIEEQLQRKI